MKIGFNISPLQNENKNRGTGSYTASLLSAFKKIKNANLEISQFTDKIPQDADLVHYPFFDPFFLTLPFLKSKPTVVTVHDLIPLKFPEKFPRGIKGEIKWQLQKLSLSQAQAVITDSKNSASDISLITGIASKKIYPIPLAANEIYKPITDKTILESIRTKYNLPERFILYVGDVNWNKNIKGLLGAFEKIKYQKSNIKNTDKNSKLYLVLAGTSFKNDLLPETKEINLLIDELQVGSNVLKLGFVPEEDLVAIYNLAGVYVQPSFYEGFGLPVLEALSCGCPVVCSNTSSLPEVGGEAVFYFDPKNDEEMAEKISSVLNYDTVQYHSVEQIGLEWAQKFSWEKTVKETLGVYEQVLRT